MWGFATFVACSALCGLAPSIAMLILFRALQALGASMIISSGPAILTGTFPPSQRGKVLGMQVLMVYLGSMIGPMLGGWLTDAFTWRAVFYINVPIGLMAMMLSLKFIPRAIPENKPERFDFHGAAFFLATFSVMLIALNQGHTYGWTSSYIVRMFVAAALLLAVFVLIEIRTVSPLLDLSLFRAPTFSLSATTRFATIWLCFERVPDAVLPDTGARVEFQSAGMLMTVQPLVMVISALRPE